MGGGGAGGGGGTGGDGGGGVAGWSYPLVLTCKVNNVNNIEFVDLPPGTVTNCGYDFPSDFLDETENNGTQNLTATRYKDIVNSETITNNRTGKTAAAITNFQGSFRNLISPRWSRDSSYGNQNCGGKSDYSVKGANGGANTGLGGSDTVKDTSTVPSSGASIIIKTIKE